MNEITGFVICLQWRNLHKSCSRNWLTQLINTSTYLMNHRSPLRIVGTYMYWIIYPCILCRFFVWLCSRQLLIKYMDISLHACTCNVVIENDDENNGIEMWIYMCVSKFVVRGASHYSVSKDCFKDHCLHDYISMSDVCKCMQSMLRFVNHLLSACWHDILNLS